MEEVSRLVLLSGDRGGLSVPKEILRRGRVGLSSRRPRVPRQRLQSAQIVVSKGLAGVQRHASLSFLRRLFSIRGPAGKRGGYGAHVNLPARKQNQNHCDAIGAIESGAQTRVRARGGVAGERRCLRRNPRRTRTLHFPTRQTKNPRRSKILQILFRLYLERNDDVRWKSAVHRRHLRGDGSNVHHGKTCRAKASVSNLQRRRRQRCCRECDGNLRVLLRMRLDSGDVVRGAGDVPFGRVRKGSEYDDGKCCGEESAMPEN
mmetsp:Transcript_2280/g.4911  ORF Transcript_2280/g.4911 Transcript_2280/m.4911 type:complete len:261 (+) Transcript_2280:944-1726(+)